MNNWIDVTDQQPEKDGRYLAYYGSIFIANYSKANDKWVREYPNSGLSQAVTHWMPLPDPPK